MDGAAAGAGGASRIVNFRGDHAGSVSADFRRSPDADTVDASKSNDDDDASRCSADAREKYLQHSRDVEWKDRAGEDPAKGARDRLDKLFW